MPNDLYRTNHPGSSGNYISADDVNLLDADTAHLHQSIGGWVNNFRFGAPSLSTDLTPEFGSNHLQAIASSAGEASIRWSAVGTGSIPISAATEHSINLRYANDQGLDMGITVRQYDSGGNILSTVTEKNRSMAADTWTGHTYTFTSHASAAFVLLYGILQGASIGDIAYFDKICIRTGSDATFIPSINIVGDLDMRAKIALTDYTDAAAQALLDTLTSFKGHRLAITTGGEIEGRMGNGSADNTGTSTGAAFVNGTPYEIKATQDISTGLWKFYKDAVNFDDDALGAAITPSAAANALAVGADVAGTALLTTGDIYWIEDRDGIGGPIVRKYDAQLAFEAA